MAFYSFDTSALLNGRRDLFPPDTFPTLWERIEGMISDGIIGCVDEVDKELLRREDAIRRWAKAQDGLYLPLAEDIQLATTAILRNHPLLMGKGKGRNAADPFVIALARVRRGAVVTEERRRNIANPKIPDVCDALHVPCLTLVQFIQEQGWSF